MRSQQILIKAILEMKGGIKMAKWILPVDPDCPEVKQFSEGLFNDAMTQHYGIGDEIMEGWEDKHKGKCKRCQMYGAANVEVGY